MGNKNKKPAVEAPVVEKPAAEEVDKNTPATVQMPGIPSGLSQNAKVQYAAVLQHRKDEMLKGGGENANKYVALTLLEDATILDIAVTEAVVRKNPMGLIFSTNEKNWMMLQELAKEMGVSIRDFKSLPKPTKEQLKAAGLEAAPGQVVLKLENKDVSSKAKAKVEAEAKINNDASSDKKEYLTDHTKIETDEQLKEALGFQLVNNKIASPLDRIITAAQFYRAYREALAEKSDNPQTELAKVHELTLSDLLQEISTMVPPSFTAEGFGRLLCKRITDTKSVVPAFEMLKRCGRKRNDKEFKFSDEEIAALVRVLVVWKASSEIASIGSEIKRLSKDAKKNAKAIEDANNRIMAEQELMAYVTEPDFELADNFIAAYNNKEHAMHKSAKDIAGSIIETYYKDVDIPELEMDTALLNIQQHIGIDLNLFNSDLGKRDEYDPKNLIDMSSEKPKEEKPAEGESKNA
jgi:hypothetical protein